MKRLILVGGGHAHVQVLAKWITSERPKSTHVTLVAPSKVAAYSGMLPGALVGEFEMSQMHFDLQALSERAGVERIEDRVTALSCKNGELSLVNGEILKFDLLSLNVGAESKSPKGHAKFDNVIAIKPVESFLKYWMHHLEETRKHWVVVGGGAAAVEMALAIAQVPNKSHRVTLVTGEARVMSERSGRAQARLRIALERSGVEVLTEFRVESFGAGTLQSQGGRELEFDHCLLATGSGPSKWFAQTDLRLTQSGFIEVDAHLRAAPNVFAVGDCAEIRGHDLPKAGVFAVRQGPILKHNLQSLAENRQQEMKRFEPQKKFLALLRTGPKLAVFSYGSLAFEAHWVWALKRKIDVNFMKKFGAN